MSALYSTVNVESESNEFGNIHSSTSKKQKTGVVFLALIGVALTLGTVFYGAHDVNGVEKEIRAQVTVQKMCRPPRYNWRLLGDAIGSVATDDPAVCRQKCLETTECLWWSMYKGNKFCMLVSSPSAQIQEKGWISGACRVRVARPPAHAVCEPRGPSIPAGFCDKVDNCNILTACSMKGDCPCQICGDTKAETLAVVGETEVFSESNPMMIGNGFERFATQTIGFSPNELNCALPKQRVAAFLRGFAIHTEDQMRLNVQGATATPIDGQVRFRTWLNTRVATAAAGFLSTCESDDSIFIQGQSVQTVNGPHELIIVETGVFNFPCVDDISGDVVEPTIFAAFNYIDQKISRQHNARLELSASIKTSKKNADRGTIAVKFQTRNGGKFYAAGAAVVAFCPRMKTAARTGTVSIGADTKLAVGNGVRQATLEVLFDKPMPCEYPRVTVGLTGYEFLPGTDLNIIDVGVDNAKSDRFTIAFATSGFARVTYASAGFIASCVCHNS